MEKKEMNDQIKTIKIIQEIREKKGLSIGSMAKKTGLSPDHLIKIEEGKIVPALGVLIKISKALEVKMGAIMGEEPIQSFMIVRKDEMGKHLHHVSKESLGYDYSYIALGHEKKDRRMEPFLVTLEPGTTESEKVSVHEGEEFIYVLEGELEISLDQNKEILLPGDSIYYDGSIPHTLSKRFRRETEKRLERNLGRQRDSLLGWIKRLIG